MSTRAGRLLLTEATLIDVTATPRAVPDAWLLCEGDRILDLGTGRPPAAEAGTEYRDLGGAFLAPGFVSSHSHLFTSVARGLGINETLYGWVDAMYAVTSEASPEDVYWATMHGAAENLANGITCVFDFVDPRTAWQSMREREQEPRVRPVEHVHRQVDAHADAGIRSVLAIQIEGKGRAGAAAWTDFTDAVRYIRDGDRRYLLEAAVYGAAQWAEEESLAATEVKAMRTFDIVNQAHLLETSEQLEAQRERFDWYVRAGALGEQMIFGHFVHPSPQIVDQCVDAGCAVSWQPVANGRLASGAADVTRLRERGVRLGLGLDDHACSDVSDPWQNMRVGLYQARARTETPALGVADVLRMQTLGAAEIIGVGEQVGSLEPGKRADLLVVDPRHPDIGPLHDPLASYVLSVTLRNLRAVYVGAELVADDGGAHLSADGRLNAEIHARFSPRPDLASG